MNLDSILKLAPKSLQRKAVAQLAALLKKLLRDSHKGMELQEGEEDFGLLLFQEDATNAESKLYAVVTTLNSACEVQRSLKAYEVDNLIDLLQKEI